MNLLRDPIFGVRIDDQDTEQLTLPGVLARLEAGADLVFTGLQPHQEHAWMAFLAYLAASVLHRAGEAPKAHSETWWKKNIKSLSEVGWDLVESDPSKPAFLQPPTELNLFDEPLRPTPDGADMIPTAANHARKTRLITKPSPEHWAYALVSLQGQANSIAKYFGTPRTTSSGRVCVDLVPSYSVGDRFQRDVTILLAERDRLLRTYHYCPDGDADSVLLWLRKSNGDTTLGYSDLDPFFIDTPRIYRLREEDGRIVGYRLPTKVAQVRLNAGTGDIWTPIDKETQRPLGLGSDIESDNTVLPTSYANIHRLVFDAKTIKPIAVSRPLRGSGYLLVSSLLTSNGKTLGFHRRVVPIPGHAMQEITDDDSQMADRSKTQVDVAVQVEKVLGTALWMLMLGQLPKSKTRNAKEFRNVVTLFTRAVDDQFFNFLFEPATDTNAWFDFLMKTAHQVLETAGKSRVHWMGRRYMGLSKASAILDNFEKKERQRRQLLDTEGETMDPPRSETYMHLHETIAKIHRYLVALGYRDRGAVARLRDLDPEHPTGEDFFKIESTYIDQADLPMASDDVREHNRRWATIVQWCALTAGLHRGGGRTGMSLASAGFSPARMERMLGAEEASLVGPLLSTAIRFLRHKRTAYSLTDLACIHLWPKSPDANDVRRRVARDFYAASRRAA